MINPFVIKKWAALMSTAMLTVILFYIGIVFYGLVIGLGFMALGLILGLVVGNILLRHPFRMMVEGKGLMTFKMDSTGILTPFIVGLHSPYIKGQYGNKTVSDVFDRQSVFQIAAPKVNSTGVKYEDDKIKIELDREEFNDARMAMYHYPVLIFNEQINSLVTKDWYAKKEGKAFAEHTLLHLNRKLEETDAHIRDFGRHIVDNLKPGTNVLKNKWIWIIIAVLLGLLIFMFAPAIIQLVGGLVQGGGGAVSAAGGAGGAIVSPR